MNRRQLLASLLGMTVASNASRETVEERFSSLSGVWITDWTAADDGRLTRVSRAWFPNTTRDYPSYVPLPPPGFVRTLVHNVIRADGTLESITFKDVQSTHGEDR